MEKLKKLCFRNWHIRSINTRITLSFSLLIAVIISFILLVTTAVFTSQFMEQKNSLVLEQLTFITQDIEANIDIFRKLSSSVRIDAVVKQYTNGDLTDYSGLEKRLSELAQYTFGVQRVMIVDANGNIMDPYYSIESVRERLLGRSELEDFATQGREEMFSKPHNLPGESMNDYMQNLSISYLSRIRDKDFKTWGYLIINSSKNYLFSGKQAYAQDLFDTLYVISKSGDIVYRCGKEDINIDQSVISFANAGYFGDNIHTTSKHTYFKQPIPSYPEWIVIGVSTDASLKKDLTIIYMTITFAAIFGFFTVVALSRMISNKITQPIQQMKSAMTEFEKGEMPQKLTPTTQDELGYLIKGFNSMLDDISRFIDAVYHEQEDKKKAEVAALKFQLESLQSQINPHFLYNTLNTVAYLALKDGNEEIRSMIQSLNLLLRSTLSDQNEFISIRQEISFLEAYVQIQRYRYEEPINVVYDIDNAVLEHKIPKLILQPLVENAFIHGIYPKGENGSITVQIISDAQSIYVSIADNGVGIERSVLQTMRDHRKGFNSVGIKNVDERLQLYYGETSQLQYDSTLSVGTIVSFVIPKEEA